MQCCKSRVFQCGKSSDLPSCYLDLLGSYLNIRPIAFDGGKKCCYEPPVRPCQLCQHGSTSYSVSDATVTFNGAETNCFGIYNYLSTRMETDHDSCLVTRNDLFDTCCYDKCSICQGYQLNQMGLVEYQGTQMSCSEIENHFVGLHQITQGSDECQSLQSNFFDDCCYDIPCELCLEGDAKHELLSDKPVVYQGVNRTCSTWSVLAESELSQSDVCAITKHDLFRSCCFKKCNLCKDPRQTINWNKPLTYDGLASTCMDVFMNLRSEGIQEGNDRCQSVQYAVSHECCYEAPQNQCSLCQTSDGSFINTNWNNQLLYQGEDVTCGDVNAMLSTKELDSSICLSTRDELWDVCCTPREGGNTGLGGILPTLPPSPDSNSNPTTGSGGSNPFGIAGFNENAYFRRPSAAVKVNPLFTVVVAVATALF